MVVSVLIRLAWIEGKGGSGFVSFEKKQIEKATVTAVFLASKAQEKEPRAPFPMPRRRESREERGKFGKQIEEERENRELNREEREIAI